MEAIEDRRRSKVPPTLPLDFSEYVEDWGAVGLALVHLDTVQVAEMTGTVGAAWYKHHKAIALLQKKLSELRMGPGKGTLMVSPGGGRKWFPLGGSLRTIGGMVAVLCESQGVEVLQDQIGSIRSTRSNMRLEVLRRGDDEVLLAITKRSCLKSRLTQERDLPAEEKTVEVVEGRLIVSRAARVQAQHLGANVPVRRPPPQSTCRPRPRKSAATDPALEKLAETLNGIKISRLEMLTVLGAMTARAPAQSGHGDDLSASFGAASGMSLEKAAALRARAHSLTHLLAREQSGALKFPQVQSGAPKAQEVADAAIKCRLVFAGEKVAFERQEFVDVLNAMVAARLLKESGGEISDDALSEAVSNVHMHRLASLDVVARPQSGR